MNVAAYQNKEKNGKTGKRKAGEDKRPILRGCVLPFCGRSGTARQKNGLRGGVSGVTETLRNANSHFDPTKRGWGRHHHVEAAVDWCSSILLALYTVYTREISHFTI